MYLNTYNTYLNTESLLILVVVFFGREEWEELMIELDDVPVLVDHAFDHHITHVGLNAFTTHPV